MFIDREKELEILNGEYQAKGSSFTIIYGRRRVGKTTLISEYIKDKPSIFFYATEANIDYQLQLFTDLIIEFIGKKYLREITLTALSSFLFFCLKMLKTGKLSLPLMNTSS